MGYVKVKGIVIKEVNTGEADKIITIFSRQRGKMTASARGARRPTSKYAAGTQILGYNDYVLFSGKDMYSVNSSEVIEPFYEIRNDIVKLTYAAHILEIVSDTLQENQPANRALQLLLNTFHILAKTDRDPALATLVFELRYLAISGYAPFVSGCSVCGNEAAESYTFSFRKCGLLCGKENCAAQDQFSQELSPGAVRTLRHIVYSRAEELFSFSLSPQILAELGRLSRRYLRERLEKDYTRLDMLKSIERGTFTF
ncbi:MAG: DNA repair protein RecO [Clostridiales bacterium]|nr:DNA repair protein RecO [Clostridiales bacterium]